MRILDGLAEAKEKQLRVLYADETNFTKRSIQTLEWSSRLDNLNVDQKQIYSGYRLSLIHI